MNLQIEMRKIIDAINSQPLVIAIMLWVFVFVFIIIPFALPAALIYFIWAAFKGREQSK